MKKNTPKNRLSIDDFRAAILQLNLRSIRDEEIEALFHPQPCSLHPEPWTPNPEPWTLDPEPWTLNPAPCTLNPQP